MHLQQQNGDAQLETSLKTMEMAFRMQMAVPEAFDVDRETPATLEPSLSSMIRTSLRPGLLMPASAWPKRTPFTGLNSLAIGNGEFTGMVFYL